MGFKHRTDIGPESEVRKSHDSCRYIGHAVGMSRVLGGDALYKRRLTHGTQFPGPIFSIHGSALNGHGLDDPVPTPGVPQILIEQVPAPLTVSGPEVMVGIANGQVRVYGILYP